MRGVKPPGQRLMARNFDRQVAALQVRIAVRNGDTALGPPVTQAVGQVCPGKAEARPSENLCNRVTIFWKIVQYRIFQKILRVAGNDQLRA
jgi:hypothetical protein